MVDYMCLFCFWQGNGYDEDAKVECPRCKTANGLTRINEYDGKYTEPPWDSPDNDIPFIDDPDKLPMISAQYPHATCYELCGYCGAEVVIPAYQEATCPVCGQPIIPCSMCAVLKDDGYWHMTCHDKCPYSKEGSE